MIEDFRRALHLVLIDEGGNDDDPHDHGGRTSRGIIQREYDAYRRRKGQPINDVWNASDAEVEEIYHDQYWLPWCDRLPAGVDYCFFDAAVNAGPVQAVLQLQKALSNVRVDGHLGMVTMGALEAACSTPESSVMFIHTYCNQRREFYKHLPQFSRYGRGWLSRTDHVEKGAYAMARGQTS